MTPPSNNQSGSRSGTPLDEENVPPLDINTSPRQLVKIARKFQVDKHNAEDTIRSLRRRLDEITNDETTNKNPHKSKRRRRDHHNEIVDDDDDPEDSDVHTASDAAVEAVVQLGRRYCMMYGPWLRTGQELFQLSLSDSFDEAERFETDDNKAQGQLREVVEVLKGTVSEEDRKKLWVRKAFLKGLDSQRANTASRIRRQRAAILGVNETDLLRPAVRQDKFRDRIGWVVGQHGEGSYSSVDVEILHRNYPGTYTLSAIFLNPVLMGLFVAIIRGPTTGKEFVDGISANPKTETMSSKHRLRNITPGAIATVAIFARWALSADECFQQVGSSTGINYLTDYEEYLSLLTNGLRKKKKSTINIFKEWDTHVSPNTTSSLVGRLKPVESGRRFEEAMALLDADSDADNDEDITT